MYKLKPEDTTASESTTTANYEETTVQASNEIYVTSDYLEPERLSLVQDKGELLELNSIIDEDLSGEIMLDDDEEAIKKIKVDRGEKCCSLLEGK